VLYGEGGLGGRECSGAGSQHSAFSSRHRSTHTQPAKTKLGARTSVCKSLACESRRCRSRISTSTRTSRPATCRGVGGAVHVSKQTGGRAQAQHMQAPQPAQSTERVGRREWCHQPTACRPVKTSSKSRTAPSCPAQPLHKRCCSAAAHPLLRGYQLVLHHRPLLSLRGQLILQGAPAGLEVLHTWWRWGWGGGGMASSQS
jgi:hypothetical protein